MSANHCEDEQKMLDGERKEEQGVEYIPVTEVFDYHTGKLAKIVIGTYVNVRAEQISHEFIDTIIRVKKCRYGTDYYISVVLSIRLGRYRDYNVGMYYHNRGEAGRVCARLVRRVRRILDEKRHKRQ
jgi:hypothetical protein